MVRDRTHQISPVLQVEFARWWRGVNHIERVIILNSIACNFALCVLPRLLPRNCCDGMLMPYEMSTLQRGIHANFANSISFHAGGAKWNAKHLTCPECQSAVIRLVRVPIAGNQTPIEAPAYPPTDSLRPVPAEVPDPYKRDFIEACAVLLLSPKASAAISRRNLQAIIRDRAGVKGKDLNVEIQTVIDSGKVPSYISEGLHAIRQIGNFSAHPIKSTSTGEIVEVEEGEAEWNLDVLESLFDFYFVQPALTAKRKSELNKKLKEAGKPEIL
jgi:hypothetical protein